MTRKTLLAAALAAGSLMGVVSVAQAVPAVVADSSVAYPATTTTRTETVIVQTAPPTPLQEAIPAPREGYVWAPGHYEWRHGQYVWERGEWMTARAGYAYHPGHWEQRGDGSWMFVAGRWMRGDDVAFANDGRRGPFGDRDGDGVINRDDRYPRDPSRY
jgi:hypothetical protein